MSTEENAVKTYALTPAIRARLMGWSLIGIVVFLVIATLVVGFLHIPTIVMFIIVVLVPVVIAVLASVYSKRFYVLRLDAIGYRTRFVGGIGAKQARWADVLDLGVLTIKDARCIQLRLRSGETTTVAVDVLQTDPEELVREFGRRLEAANGKVVIREEAQD